MKIKEIIKILSVDLEFTKSDYAPMVSVRTDKYNIDICASSLDRDKVKWIAFYICDLNNKYVCERMVTDRKIIFPELVKVLKIWI